MISLRTVSRGAKALVLALVCASLACAQPVAPIGTAVPEYLPPPAPGEVLRDLKLDRALEDRILALDPDAVTGEDVRNVLARGPAPRIINIHGGVPLVYLVMASLSKFLIGMGYPEERIRIPATGDFSWNPYGESVQEAGSIAAFYERDGMVPMLIGHSQGGIEVVKILYEFAGAFRSEIPMWNPYIDRPAGRDFFIDPLTGEKRKVIGLKLGYVSSVGAGGSAMLLAHHWPMASRLRIIPDTVDEFTGFTVPLDFFAFDGVDGQAGFFKSAGTAKVRNIALPASYSHVAVPVTSHLAEDERLRRWIDDYRPGDKRPVPTEGNTVNILYGADVWHSVKRHWVLSAQALIRARRAYLAPT
jgi:hypothetical protein